MSVIDEHSHAWEYPHHFNDGLCDQAKRARGGTQIDLTVHFDA